MTGAALDVTGLTRAFGGVYAVHDVGLTVAPGELRAVIGPNGAGKSTLFGLIGGQIAADAGTVRLDGARVDRLPAHRRARRGIGVVFQAARTFTGMTVLENVMVGAHATTSTGFLAAALRLPAHHREEHQIRDRATACLRRTGLAGWAHRPAEELPLGQQRALQLARALCGRPRLLLLDEPASGLRAAERASLADLVDDLRGDGLTILLVEHDVAFVMRLADRVTVLDLGRVIADGSAAEIRADPRVVSAYLGRRRVNVVEVDDLTVRYAGATAVDGVSLQVAAGEPVALIGANGAGKSTLVKALAGLVQPTAGRITVRGRLAYVPEGREMFGDLTVDDNLRLGGWRNGRHGRHTGEIYRLLPALDGLRRRRAGLLSGGEQQMVAIGRALMARPDVLVVDELSLGLAPLVVGDLVTHLRTLNTDRGLAVLLIEQNARLALGLCRRAYVLEAGCVAVHGSTGDLARDPRVTAAYLGGHVPADGPGR